MTKYKSIADFLKDTYFIKSILDENSEYTKYWENYIKSHVEVLAIFNQAKEILLHIDDSSVISEEERRILKQRIAKSYQCKK